MILPHSLIVDDDPSQVIYSLAGRPIVA